MRGPVWWGMSDFFEVLPLNSAMDNLVKLLFKKGCGYEGTICHGRIYTKSATPRSWPQRREAATGQPPAPLSATIGPNF